MKKNKNCPINQIRATARNVPVAFTEQLQRSQVAVEMVQIEDFVFHNGYWNEPGSSIRIHLAICGSCRREFNWIINDRPVSEGENTDG